jgi:hypothetical protein
VLACKYRGAKEQGRVIVARTLGMTPADVRRCERSIARKLERFAAILSAGSLCTHRAPAVLALAEGSDAGPQEQAARMHLRHCSACRAAYAAHLHAVRTGTLQRRIGQIIPLPGGTEAIERRRGSPWETVWDWVTRPFTHETAASLTQVATASRGIGAVITAKLAAVCIAGGAIVGGGMYCVARLATTPPMPRAGVTHPASDRSGPREQPLPTGGRSAAMRLSTSSSSRGSSRTRRARSTTGGTAFAKGPVQSRHEREAPISPPTTTSSGGTLPEFGPAPASTAPSQPAVAPSTGAPEFP